MKWIIRILCVVVIFIAIVLIYASVTYKDTLKQDTSWLNDSETNAQDLYFPAESISEFCQHWYNKHLVSMNEPILWKSGFAGETYRFTWLRTFHNPISVRVDIPIVGEAKLTYKVLDGQGGYEPGIIKNEGVIVLSDSQVNQVRQSIDTSKFWKRKTHAGNEFSDHFLDTLLKCFFLVRITHGCDGAQWIFEGKTQNQYHIVDRWSGGEESHENLCLDFLRMSGLKIEEDKTY